MLDRSLFLKAVLPAFYGTQELQLFSPEGNEALLDIRFFNSKGILA